MKNYLRIFFSDGLGDIAYSNRSNDVNNPNITGADDGLSKTGANARLGQVVGAAGDPARLLENREIPFNLFSLILRGLGITGSSLVIQDAAVPDATPEILFTNSAGAEISRVKISESLFAMFFGLQSGGSSLANPANFFNTAFGAQALQFLVTGDGNIALGARALRDVVTGRRNIAIGGGALQGNPGGNNNIGIGVDTLNQGGGPLGDFNIVLGNNTADIAGGVGNRNIIIGQFSTNSVGGAIGDDIIAIGTTLNLQGGPSNSIFIISRGTGAAALNNSNVIVLGDDSQNTLIGLPILTMVDDGQRLQVNGATKTKGLQAAIRTITANDNFTDQDFTLLVDTTAGNVNVTVNPVTGKTLIGNIKKISADANTVTITPASGTIQELGAAAATFVFNTQGQSVTFQSNATNLYVI